MTLSIRRARLDDAEAIAAVHVSSWEGAYRGMVPDGWLDTRTVAAQASLWRDLLAGAAQVLVAEHRRAIVGFCSASCPSRDEDADEDTAEISALYVDPRRWRTGTGAALMEAALSAISSAGFETVTLWVLEPNARARAFYSSAGFTCDGGRQRVADGWPEEIRLRRALG